MSITIPNDLTLLDEEEWEDIDTDYEDIPGWEQTMPKMSTTATN